MILSAQLMVDSGDFVVEHLVESDENRILLKRFTVGKGADGLEEYLKSCALDDEISSESRTYLVKDSVSRALACYFSLRTCLVPLALDDEAFVYSHVKPKYDDGCIFMYQCIERASVPI